MYNLKRLNKAYHEHSAQRDAVFVPQHASPNRNKEETVSIFGNINCDWM